MAEETSLTRSEELYAKAAAGEKLETDQRRDVIAYLMVVNPELTNSDMARLFGLSEGAIRKDKEIIRKRAADELSGEDVGLVIADIRRTYDRFVKDINAAMKLASAGTKTYLDYQKSLVDYQLKMIEALQSLGFYPKNLGILQKNQFVFKSVVAKDGSIDTRAIDEPRTIEGKIDRRTTAKASHIATAVIDPEEDSLRNALRDEFSDTPADPRALPAPSGDYSDGA